MRDANTGPSYVLRAMAAAEIAESCPEGPIRESFFQLAGSWLTEAERAYCDGRRAPPCDGSSSAPQFGQGQA